MPPSREQHLVLVRHPAPAPTSRKPFPKKIIDQIKPIKTSAEKAPRLNNYGLGVSATDVQLRNFGLMIMKSRTVSIRVSACCVWNELNPWGLLSAELFFGFGSRIYLRITSLSYPDIVMQVRTPSHFGWIKLPCGLFAQF
jgi:hypothetical protein